MATYSFNIKTQPKTKYGPKLNAASHYEYIDREGAYKDREDLLASGSGNMPDWAPAPYHYWKAASTYERANGNAYREITWALPSEFPLAVNRELVDEFCKQTFGDKFTYSYSIHSKPSSDPEHNNVHVHIMFNERELDHERQYNNPRDHFSRYTEIHGMPFGYKKEEAFSKKAMYYALRERAATLTNQFYENLQFEERVDHRSFKDQKKALEAEGRFSEAALLDVPPKKRIPAAQYYREKRNAEHMIDPLHPVELEDVIYNETEINKAHNEVAKELRHMQSELYEAFFAQDTIYTVNIKDYFGDLKFNLKQQKETIEQQIAEMRKEQVPDKAVETWAKNQIVKGYSKKAKQLKSIIETAAYKEQIRTITPLEWRKAKEAKEELQQLEAKIPLPELEERKKLIQEKNELIKEQVKPLYGSIKQIEGKIKKYDRILSSLDKIPNDTVMYKISEKGILINNNSINKQNNSEGKPILSGQNGRLPNGNSPRMAQKSYASSPSKLAMISNLAKKIDKKVDSMVISNTGGFVATQELTAEDIQEMITHGRSLS